jgi:hypothetical protein
VPISSNPLEGILALPKTNIDAILGHNFALFSRQGEWIEITIVLVAIVVGAIFVLVAKREVNVTRVARTLRQWTPEMTEARKETTLMLVAWIGTYVLFLLFWGPLIYYRAFYTPAISLGLGLVLRNYHGVTRNKPSGAAVLAVVALALLNLGFYIGPNMRADSNMMVAGALNAGKLWNERTVIYFAARTEADTSFEYFNPSTDWRKLSRVSPSGLDSEIAGIYNRGGSVWLNRSAALLVDAEWLARHSSGETIEVDAPNAPALYVKVIPKE